MIEQDQTTPQPPKVANLDRANARSPTFRHSFAAQRVLSRFTLSAVHAGRRFLSLIPLVRSDWLSECNIAPVRLNLRGISM